MGTINIVIFTKQLPYDLKGKNVLITAIVLNYHGLANNSCTEFSL